MYDCDHCGGSFDEEAAYLRHLRDEHHDELGRIERRRVDGLDDGGGPPTSTIALGVAGVLFALIVGGLLVSLGSGNSSAGAATTFVDDSVRQPASLGTVHEHGPMTVTVDGRSLDFSQNKYQLQDDFFHYENGDGSTWHVHGQGVTLEYALESLGMGVTQNGFAFGDEVYRASEGSTVVYEVNGQPVDPERYVLQDGDRVRVVADDPVESSDE
ncbi:EGFR-like transmembrane domain-containing protein [Haloarchaeobius amylolyticus]|uniref:EGFR-like transmembrane domain-containing protein n=1 Tax=Haloarchaeobius amylolyticus TaxID=1198296 RepID=UPI0022712A46